jgi:hypothetical protein
MCLSIIYCNLTRRHLNKFQRTELALKSKSILEEIAEQNTTANLPNQKNDLPSQITEQIMLDTF